MAYKDIFNNPHTFLAVVHAESISQAIDNSRIAVENGADGIFLINHGMSTGALLSTYNAVEQHIPEDTWIGLNFLTEPLYHRLAETLPMDCPAVWTDENGIHENEAGVQDSYEALDFMKKLKARNPDCLWFGGVGFKGQRPANLLNTAKTALRYMDVITTSGDQTGRPPSVEKIRTIREAIGDHPLAIASGMTPDNVRDFMLYANCFLVASGISTSFTELDPARVRAFADALRA